MSSTRSPSKKAPAIKCGRAAGTLVLCGHGTRGAGGVLNRHAAAMRSRALFADVRVCSLYGTPGLAETLDEVVSPEICVVPWLMCAGFTMDRLRAAVDGHPAAHRIVLAEPVGDIPGVADLAAGIAMDECRRRGWSPATTGLLLIGHGSGRNMVSAETTRRHAARISEGHGFAAVASAFLDEPPSPGDVLDSLDTPNCVAIGLFAERSLHGEDDVPRLLGAGRNVAYTGPIGAAPDFAGIIAARAGEAWGVRRSDAA